MRTQHSRTSLGWKNAEQSNFYTILSLWNRFPRYISSSVNAMLKSCPRYQFLIFMPIRITPYQVHTIIPATPQHIQVSSMLQISFPYLKRANVPYFWSVDVLYSLAYTFIDIWWALPAPKLLATSSYNLGLYRYGWGSRTFRNITTYSIYILIQGWLSMTQPLLEHSWRSHYILSSLQRLTNNSWRKSREITLPIAVY